MSDPEGFLQRWSRRKLARAEPAAPADPAGQPDTQPNTGDASQPSEPARQDAAVAGRAETAPFDPASLPPIESIDANSDVTAFLRPGVRPDLTRAALRKAWTSDPTIRDFVGLVENGWDFNNPDAVGGFGPISAEEVAQLTSKLIAQLPETTDVGAEKKLGRNEQKALLPQKARTRLGEGEGMAEAAEPAGNDENDALQKKSEG